MFMVLITMAPEVVVALAVNQYLITRKSWLAIGKRYSITHAFFAEMGGFVLRVQEPRDNATTEGQKALNGSVIKDYFLSLGDLGQCPWSQRL